MGKIAVLSDIHGNIVALEQVVADIQRRNVEVVVNLGDHVSGPLWPKETLDFLKSQNWIQIKGNHERQLLTMPLEMQGASDQYTSLQINAEDKKWLNSLSNRAEIGEEIVAYHGGPDNDKLYLLEQIENGVSKLAPRDMIKDRLGTEKAAIILCGHTHLPRVVQVSTQTLIVNPGSVGLPAYSDIEPEPHVMETGSPHARYAILEKVSGQWQVDLIAIEYDQEKAAAQARKNNRMDWTISLQTGYVRK